MTRRTDRLKLLTVGDRARLVKSVQTPAGLFALAFLIVEGILAALAIKASGNDFTLLVGGMLVSFLTLVVVFFALATRRPELFQAREPAPARLSAPGIVDLKYDVFLSVPMAATDSDEEYKALRERTLALIATLKTECQFQNIYYAGDGSPTKADFDPPKLAVLDDFERVKQTRYFVLLYPSKLASSALIETGFALALGKTIVVFVRRRDDLPFLLRSAESLKSVSIYEYADDEKLTALIKRSRNKLFA